jgi:hypothetical protein
VTLAAGATSPLPVAKSSTRFGEFFPAECTKHRRHQTSIPQLSNRFARSYLVAIRANMELTDVDYGLVGITYMGVIPYYQCGAIG